jgi:hypothetical protein
MQLQGEVDVDCVPLVNILGAHFQIRDDYINLTSDEVGVVSCKARWSSMRTRRDTVKT